MLNTRRRTLLEQDRLCGFPFEDERRSLRTALLGEEAMDDGTDAA